MRAEFPDDFRLILILLPGKQKANADSSAHTRKLLTSKKGLANNTLICIIFRSEQDAPAAT
jgi:hypothetical protein